MNVVYTTMYIPPKVTFFSFLFSYCTIDRLIVTVQTPFRFSTTIIISRHKKYHCATSLSFSLNCGYFRTKTLISKQTTDTWLSKRISYQSLLRNDYLVKLIGNIFFHFTLNRWYTFNATKMYFLPHLFTKDPSGLYKLDTQRLYYSFLYSIMIQPSST